MRWITTDPCPRKYRQTEAVTVAIEALSPIVGCLRDEPRRKCLGDLARLRRSIHPARAGRGAAALSKSEGLRDRLQGASL
jgi:hypothetical protein